MQLSSSFIDLALLFVCAVVPFDDTTTTVLAKRSHIQGITQDCCKTNVGVRKFPLHNLVFYWSRGRGCDVESKGQRSAPIISNRLTQLLEGRAQESAWAGKKDGPCQRQ
ncbi:hypothetical protein B0H19DRAFT_1080712 [Mycena capillaripes]|nr:hypothetical protein B0H19DRAFT_1080712 [Mycena capillaripes]